LQFLLVNTFCQKSNYSVRTETAGSEEYDVIFTVMYFKTPKCVPNILIAVMYFDRSALKSPLREGSKYMYVAK